MITKSGNPANNGAPAIKGQDADERLTEAMVSYGLACCLFSVVVWSYVMIIMALAHNRAMLDFVSLANELWPEVALVLFSNLLVTYALALHLKNRNEGRNKTVVTIALALGWTAVWQWMNVLFMAVRSDGIIKIVYKSQTALVVTIGVYIALIPIILYAIYLNERTKWGGE